MGKKLSKNATLEEALDHLLGELCERGGYCLPQAETERIASMARLTADEFAIEVLKAEGLNPEYEKRQFRFVRDRFIERFGTSVSQDSPEWPRSDSRP